MTALEDARRIADEVLFPAALDTDRSETIPRRLLDAIAGAGLYGLAGPGWAGGLDAGIIDVAEVIETLATGCLTTAFVYSQHHGAVRAAANSDNPAVRDLLEPLCRGEVRAGVALGAALPGPPRLMAYPDGDAWILQGSSPWVSGWGNVDVVHTSARTEDGRLVWSFVEASESERVMVDPTELVALGATATVSMHLDAYRVEPEGVTSVIPFEPGVTPPEVLRIHSAFPIGVVRRCISMLGPSSLEDELRKVRAELDRLDPETIQAARATAGELALRAASALMVATGSRSLLLEENAQRLAREALFVLVYALRPDSKLSLLATLGVASPRPDRG